MSRDHGKGTELHFLPPDLRHLDDTTTEVLAACLFVEERPVGGVASLVNWRLAGRIDRLTEAGFLTGAAGEVMLLPGRPRLPADKVLLFGLGARDAFDEASFDQAVTHMLRTLEDLCVRSAVVELPGRPVDALPPELAADRFLAAARTHDGVFDSFSLLETPANQQRITQHMIEERRRVRKL